MMKIEQLTHIDDTVSKAFEKLIPQLTGRNSYPSREELQKILQTGNSFIFVAREGDEILGTLSLVVYKIPTGKKAWIEDVVVDENARGKGVAALLVNHALDMARAKGIEKVDLTSTPARTAANKLYQKLGFGKRDTNVYRFTL